MHATEVEYGMHGKVARRKPLVAKKNFAACLQFAESRVVEPEGYWENVWADETWIRCVMLANDQILQSRTLSHLSNRISHVTTKSWWWWQCHDLAASGQGQLVISDTGMHYEMYMHIYRQMSRYPTVSWSSSESGTCSETTTPKNRSHLSRRNSTSYIILCTKSNSPSNDASSSRARGLNLTRRPWPVRSDEGFFRLVRLACSTQGERNRKVLTIQNRNCQVSTHCSICTLAFTERLLCLCLQ